MKPDQAAKVLEADLANILRKVKAGKTLTARERTIVESSGNTKAKPLTWKALAGALGISPVTLWEWRKDKQDDVYHQCSWRKIHKYLLCSFF